MSTSHEIDRLERAMIVLEDKITELKHQLQTSDRERAQLAAENIDLKNQLADLRHEEEMNRWLK